MRILFSIVITTYNRPLLLRRAIKSVVQQTYKDWELIIVNDGSDIAYDSDFSPFNSSIVYFYKENSGLPSSRNFGISKAKGDFICFLDDDDEYLSNHLMVLSKLVAANPDAGLYRTLTKICKGGVLKPQDFDESFGGNPIQHLLSNIMTVNNVCLPRRVFQQYRFDPSISIAEDYDLWLRIAFKYKFVHSNEFTTIYYIEPGSMSAGSLEKYEKYIEVYSYILSHPQIRKFLRKEEVEEVLLKYYKFSLYNSANEGNTRDSLKMCFKIFQKKVKYVFQREPYLLVLKTVLKK